MEQEERQNLSRKERRYLKRERKRLEKLKEQRKKNFLKRAKIVALLIILSASFFLFKYFKAKRYENAPKIQVTPIAYDFGKVLASEGKVKTTFEVRNIGVSRLTFSGMKTSCGCTTAVLNKDGEKSPAFGMHDNPTDWSASLEPGREAELIVVFDPNFHKDAFGSVTRAVSIFSNDPGKKEEKVTVYADIQP